MSRRYAFCCTWPPILVLLIELGITLLLPSRYTFVHPSVVAVVLALAFALAAWAFVEQYKERARTAFLARFVMLSILTLVVIALLANLVVLLASGGKDMVVGWRLFSSGIQVWVSNLLIFGLWFWLLDRGGPQARITHDEGARDFLFPEMTADGTADPAWTPTFIEYMYLSFTNCTAFSPTDTLPLSSRVRILMAVEALISLVTIALVAARAVNIM